MSIDHVLHAEGVRVLRGTTRTLDGLSLAVRGGEVYALLGGNGAGKTTTLNVFLGFVTAAEGQVAVAGVDPARDPARARSALAYLPENVALYPYLTGRENLQYFCALAGVDIHRDRAHVLLDGAGLAGAAHDKRVQGYSKGMRQKVGLAIAYAKNAAAMLLDEPTSGLDPSAANDFAARIRQAADDGMAVLMATHDLFNALQVADRIGIMRAGRLVDTFDAHEVDHADLERIYLAHAREQ